MAGRWQAHGQPAVTDEWLSQAANSRHPPEERPSTNLRPHRLTGDNRDSRETENMSVVEDFDYWRGKPDLAVAVAAIKALTAVIKRSKATTMMGLEIELKKASEELKEREKSSISLAAGCELFLRFVTRTSALEHEDINAGKERLIERGEQFSEISIKARQTIAKAGADFVRDGCTILTHGVSRVVVSLLKLAASQGKHFSVICPEGRPDGKGIQTARELTAVGIPVTLILDTGVAYVMERVDMVLCGAEGVVESGGIINNLGTYQIAVVARAFHKPVYVAAESYKFARLYPLDQRDLPYDPKPVSFTEQLPPNLKVDNPSRDYTPPSCLTLLFTDLGVLTPSAVSDELIQLYL